MRKSKYSEYQIIAILKAVEAGRAKKTSVVSTSSARRLSRVGSGKQSTAAWKRLTSNGCGNWEEEDRRLKQPVRRAVLGPSNFERGAHKKALSRSKEEVDCRHP
jgi:hypothetical protein